MARAPAMAWRLPSAAALLCSSLMLSASAAAQDADAAHADAPAPPASLSADADPDGTQRGPRVLSEAQSAQARAHFEEGLVEMDAARWQQAVHRFEAALAIQHTHAAAYNLASALARLGAKVRALSLLRDIASDAHATSLARNSARLLLISLQPALGSLTLRATGDVTGVTFTIGERKLSAEWLGQPVVAEPGENTVRVFRDGQLLSEHEVLVGGASPMEQELNVNLIGPRAAALAATPAAAPAEAHAADDGEPPLLHSWWFWAAAGLAVTAAVVTVALATDDADEDTRVAGSDGAVIVLLRTP